MRWSTSRSRRRTPRSERTRRECRCGRPAHAPAVRHGDHRARRRTRRAGRRRARGPAHGWLRCRGGRDPAGRGVLLARGTDQARRRDTTSARHHRWSRTGAAPTWRASSPRSTRPSMPESMQYLLPDLGEGMTEAELVQWRVTVGEHVTRDQIVAHVQTDKAEVELPVPASGTVVALGAEVGDLVPVGAPLLELVPDAGSAIGGTPVRGRATASTAGPSSPASARRAQGPSTAPAGTGPVLAAPPVRKLAKELGIDLATVTGTGPGGRVTASDLRVAPRDRWPAGAAARRPARDGTQHGGGVARGAAHLVVRRDRRPPAPRRVRHGARPARCRHHPHCVLRARRGRRPRRVARPQRELRPRHRRAGAPRHVQHRYRGGERRRSRRSRRARRARPLVGGGRRGDRPRHRRLGAPATSHPRRSAAQRSP